MSAENCRLLCLFQVWFPFFETDFIHKSIRRERFIDVLWKISISTGYQSDRNFNNLSVRNSVVLLRNLGHVSQYFTSEPSPQLLLPGPSALDTISLPTVSLPPHSHHATAGPHQLHPGLSPFASNSSFGSSSRSSSDIAEKCIQSPGISLHASWNTLTQAWSIKFGEL